MRNFLKAIKKVSKKVETVSALVVVGCMIVGGLALITGSVSKIIQIWG